MQSHSSSETSSVGVRLVRPAQFTRIWTEPNSLTVAASSASRLDLSVTSAGIASDLRSAARTCSAADSTRSVRLPVGTTLAPASARPRARVRPMPDVPPITTAVLSFRSSAGYPISRCYSPLSLCLSSLYESISSQRNRRLRPHLKLAMLVDLRLGLNFSAGNAADVIKHVRTDPSDRRLSIQNVACGKIQIAGHASENLIVRSQLDHRSDCIADRRSAACRENNHVGPGSDQAGRRLLIVAGPLHQKQPLAFWRHAIVSHTFHARRAGLGDGAQRLDRDVKQTAFDVARAWILVEHRAPFARIVLVPVNHFVNGARGGGVFRALRQDMLRAAKLRDLGDQNCPARAHQQIGSVAKAWIRGNTGERV